MRLLVVEDDTLIADSLTRSLGPLGNTVEVFSRLSEARAALANGQFDLVVLDLGLPDGNGLSLLADLRRRGNATPGTDPYSPGWRRRTGRGTGPRS